VAASSGYTADQMVAAIAERFLSTGLSRQWRQYIHEETSPPSLRMLYFFLDRQRKSAPDGRLTQLKQPKPKGPASSKQTVFKLQESKPPQDQPRAKFSYCDQSHAIYTCTSFKDLTESASLEQARQKKLYFNCLGSVQARNGVNSVKPITILSFKRNPLPLL